MKTTDYLDSIQVKYSLASDYAISKILGISRQAISNYRSGRGSLDDTVALRAADLLEIEPGIVLLDMYIERTRVDKTRDVWRDIQAGFHAPSTKPKSGRRHRPAPRLMA
jgi:transcriptional regulator with XRE-family HTH domain